MSTLRITRRASDRLRAGHLWVYRTDLETQQTDTIEPGALVTLVDTRNIPLGTAIYSSASTLVARLVARTPELPRSQYLADIRSRIAAAIALRRQLVPINAETNAHRLIFSEADDLPGIIADRYNDLVLLQLLTQGTAQDDVRSVVVEALREGLSLDGSSLTIWERPDPRIRELEQLAAPPASALFSSSKLCHSEVKPKDLLSARNDEYASAPTTTTFALNGLHFQYDAASGQKTGAFLDQRLNYAAAAAHVKASGHTGKALDICTYQGGFALHLAQVCESVTGVDASHAALEAADRNLLLNPSLTAHVEWIEADAFEYLRHLDSLAHPTHTLSSPPKAHPIQNLSSRSETRTLKNLSSRSETRTPKNLSSRSETRTPKNLSSRPESASFADGAERPAVGISENLFDAIVLDPPAFAKSKRATEGALRGYKELNLRAMRLLTPGGTLITNSCSHHVSLEEFTAIVASAAADAGRRVQLLETRSAAPDHPEILTLPETRYLKCLICRVN
jgi:23S rRNA (cytosine1962-C5)-methyltransferase